MRITVVGTGYVGLVTGTCFAEVGIDTTCVDIDSKKIENLRKGISPIYEPGLDSMIERNIQNNHLHFSTDLISCLTESEVVFMAVGTPPDEDGSADLRYVIEVARSIGKNIVKYLLIVTKSTVPVGTAIKVREAIDEELKKRKIQISFDIASNPEFLKEGDAINDFMNPDRIVIGIESDRSKELLTRLYKPFTLNGHQIIFMDIASAEMTKYVANSMLATRISFMNDVANLCEIVGADVGMVRNGIGSDSRIGNKFLNPGIGYGGSCFPKDVKALIKTADQNGYSMRVLKAVEAVNSAQKQVLFKKIYDYFKGELSGKTIAVWGLAFKPLTDDMREAPSLDLIKLLKSEGCEIKVYDPVAMHEAKKCLGESVKYSMDPYATVENADCLVLVTEWNEFRSPDWIRIKSLLKEPVVFDGRNLFDANEMNSNGFIYICIGINNSKKI
jgi:UDPglucose 6-dehydrogenase